MENLIQALHALNVYQFRSESSYPDYDAQKNLSGRTHYAEASTLKYFKARILRGDHSKNGLYYVLQESLPHPDFDMQRIRRNVVFNVFGFVIGEWREECHKSPLKADMHFSAALAWRDSDQGINAALNHLNGYLSNMDDKLFNAQQALKIAA